MQIRAISAVSFAIPLIEPFAISRASVDSTRAVLVRAETEAGHGLGEAALPLGSSDTVETLLAAVSAAAPALGGAHVEALEAIGPLVDAAYAGPASGRSGLHCAIADALAQERKVPLYQALGGASAPPLVTDITLPIADPDRSAALARQYWGRGFRSFKIKVGADRSHDERTIAKVAAVTPQARLRFDANEGFAAAEALALLDFTQATGLTVECFEQPCRRDDLTGLREVRRAGVPVVADESVASMDDLEQLLAADAADGINLKLVKMGEIDRCLAIGRRAKSAGLSLMVGAMIESRLGLTAMAHLVAALDGAAWVDLDTAFLLAADPVEGGMLADGATLTLPDGPGLAITVNVR